MSKEKQNFVEEPLSSAPVKQKKEKKMCTKKCRNGIFLEYY